MSEDDLEMPHDAKLTTRLSDEWGGTWDQDHSRCRDIGMHDMQHRKSIMMQRESSYTWITFLEWRLCFLAVFVSVSLCVFLFLSVIRWWVVPIVRCKLSFRSLEGIQGWHGPCLTRSGFWVSPFQTRRMSEATELAGWYIVRMSDDLPTYVIF